MNEVKVFTTKSISPRTGKEVADKRSELMSEEITAGMIARKTERRPPPEGYEYHLPPGATEPQLRRATVAPVEAAPTEAVPQLKGKLPEDFPGLTHLDAAGLTTYAKVRKSLDTLEEIEGIGPATAEKIREAMSHPPEEEEPEE